MPTARYVTQLMGMPVSLAMRGRHAADDRGRTAWAEAVAVLRAADRVFSTYRPDSYVSRLGRGELAVGDCPPEVAEVLALGELAEAQSQGAFRIRRTRGPDPNRATPDPNRVAPDPTGVAPDPTGVALDPTAVVLDPTGVVKGWAVDRATEPLRALAETDFCLSAGGDLVCRTVGADAAPWRIGIEHPHDTRRLVAVVPVRSGAVATSGTAHRGAHLVDARTGRPPVGIASVTVLAASLTWADIDATAAYAHGPDAAGWLRTRPGRAALVVWADGSTTRLGPARAWPAARTCPSRAGSSRRRRRGTGLG